MLLSQRIAKDPGFLWFMDRSKAHLADIRMEVVRSVKFIVGNHLLGENRLVGEVTDQIFNCEGEPSEKSKNRKEEQWIKFARPPFPVVCFENQGALLLVRERKFAAGREGWDVLRVENNGCVSPMRWEILNPPDGSTRQERDISFEPYAPWYRYDDDQVDQLEIIGTALVLLVSEIMLYVNVANGRTHLYNPTKRENAPVPKPLIPYYSYRVVDLFRTRDRYISLSEILSDTDSAEDERQKRRMHVVRGHFKEKGGRLFWWSAHLRNTRNAASHGVASKDYRLHDE